MSVAIASDLRLTLVKVVVGRKEIAGGRVGWMSFCCYAVAVRIARKSPSFTAPTKHQIEEAFRGISNFKSLLARSMIVAATQSGQKEASTGESSKVED